MKEPLSIERLKRFYRRNNTLFWCAGILAFGHFFWWNVQQNRAFVSKHERREYIGPIKIPYLDELDYFKNRHKKQEESNK